MKTPKICAVVTSSDVEAVRRVEPCVDLFEIRIDYIGASWTSLVKHLKKPWLACNRSAHQGGQWQDSEAKRIAELLTAVELGASIIDIEMETPNLRKNISQIKTATRCLLSFHDWQRTPTLTEMKAIVEQQIAAGADICKVITTAQRPEDNLAVLQLIAAYPKIRMVSFAMGPLGLVSRILCPLVGGEFTYAAIEPGKESAPGQLTASDLREIYAMVTNEK